MARLTINGQKVTVDDSFLSMTPEQQNATVDEIAASLGATGPGNAPQSPAYADALSAGSQASQKFANYDPNAPKPVGRPDLMGATAATLGGLVNGIPVVGPAIQGASDAILGGASALTGGDYGETVQGLQQRRAELAAANPIADIAGQVAAPIGAFGAAAKIPAAASALGLTGTLGQQVLNGGITNALVSSADAAVRGGDALTGATIGGITGVAGPLIGRGVETASRAIGNKVGPIINSARNPTGEAARRVGSAFTRDVKANPLSVMNSADEAMARQAGLPIMNVDRGGETTKALARSVANQSPEARAAIQRTVDDRFTSQAPRAINFIKQLTGGNVDDLAYQQSLQNTARITNKPRYDAAFNSPRAQQVFTVDTQELMQSPVVQRAIDMTESRGKDMAAIAGQMPVVNPFRKGSDGRWRVVQKADGTFTAPTLSFWDQVKRNLDGMIGVAQRGGDKTETSILMQIKDKLVSSLDDAVPQYKTARQGAAAFFGAEDALDAGRSFANQPRTIPEAQQAYKAFNNAEKTAFATGYASELIDKIKASGDRRNIIQQMFGSPAAREMNELVFGRAKAQQLEAFVRVEALADMLRGAMGNSTTARQLAEMGLGGVAGGLYTQDWQGALGGALLARGARYAGERVDAKVMEEVARLLTSDNAAGLQKAVFNASQSPKWMDAVKALGDIVQAGVMTAPMTTNVQ